MKSEQVFVLFENQQPNTLELIIIDSFDHAAMAAPYFPVFLLAVQAVEFCVFGGIHVLLSLAPGRCESQIATGSGESVRPGVFFDSAL